MLYFCVLFTRFARYGRSTLRPYWVQRVLFLFVCFFLRTQHAASLLGIARFIFICFVFFADAARCVPTGGAFC